VGSGTGGVRCGGDLVWRFGAPGRNLPSLTGGKEEGSKQPSKSRDVERWSRGDGEVVA